MSHVGFTFNCPECARVREEQQCKNRLAEAIRRRMGGLLVDGLYIRCLQVLEPNFLQQGN